MAFTLMGAVAGRRRRAARPVVAGDHGCASGYAFLPQLRAK